MPNQNRSQIIGNAGERWFAQQLPPSWIPQFPTNDVGVDALVVICDPGDINGLEFRVQIKSSEKWSIRDGNIVNKKFSRNSLRYLLTGFTPTLVVFYEHSSETGYCYWLNQLFANNIDLLDGDSKNVTVKLPMSRQITESLWSEIGNEVKGVATSIGRRLANSGALEAVLETVNILTQSLHLIDLSANGREDFEYMEDRTRAELTAHKEIVLALRELNSAFEVYNTSIYGLEELSDIYLNKCIEFSPTFEAYVFEPVEGRKFEVVLELMWEFRVEANRFVTQTLHELSKLSLQSLKHTTRAESANKNV